MDQRIQEILKITGYDIDKYDNKKLEPIELLKNQVTYICNENNDLCESLRNRSNELIKLEEFDIRRHLTFSVLKNLVNRGEIEKELVINIINSLEDSSLEDDDFSLIEKKITENDEKVDIWELNFFELYVNLKSDKNDKQNIIKFLKEEIFKNDIYITTFSGGKENHYVFHRNTS